MTEKKVFNYLKKNNPELAQQEDVYFYTEDAYFYTNGIKAGIGVGTDAVKQNKAFAPEELKSNNHVVKRELEKDDIFPFKIFLKYHAFELISDVDLDQGSIYVNKRRLHPSGQQKLSTKSKKNIDVDLDRDLVYVDKRSFYLSQ